MSLQLKISSIELKDSFIVTDCTGDYSPKNNTGFGNPNIKVSEIEMAKIIITTFEGRDYEIITTGDFPNEEHAGYEIFPSMIGFERIESGQYKIRLEITGKDKQSRPFSKHTVLTTFFTKAVECCVDKMVSKNIGTENNDKRKEMISLNNFIRTMKDAIECGKNSVASKIIDYLKEQCSCCKC